MPSLNRGEGVESRYVEIRCEADSSLIRYETLENRQHLVIPVVMLIGNTVVQGANAKTPEFIPLETIERHFVDGWNSKPVVPYHPRRNGKFISANDPGVCDAARLGPLFNTRVEDGKLKTEAWIDVERCRDLDGDAQDALTKLEAGEQIDVSGGFIVEFERRKGISPGGVEYGAVWTDIDGDHLALLPNSEGACNQEMGCGAPRVNVSSNINIAAQAIDINETSQEEIRVMSAEDKKKGFLARLLSKLRPNLVFDDGESDQDVRALISKAIKQLDPAFDWVCEVYPESSSVIYITYVMTSSWEGIYRYWRRTFVLSADKKSVTVNNDAVEVRAKVVWETVDNGTVVQEDVIIAAETTSSVRSNCGCQQQATVIATQTNNDNKGKGETTMSVQAVTEDRKKKIGDLIATGRFKEEDRAELEQMTERSFEWVSAPALPIAAAAGSALLAPPITAAAASTAPADLTEAEVLQKFPRLNSIVSSFETQQEAKRQNLVTRLVPAQSVHDEKALSGMELPRLEEMAALLKIHESDDMRIDYSLVSTGSSSGAAGASQKPEIRPWDPWGLEAKKKGSSSDQPAKAN